ncbi:MAG: archaeosortase/exosortase family protein [Taibaiella sp.]|nr:archaeosortase/exosortase family protein [Taibaiella sp.]
MIKFFILRAFAIFITWQVLYNFILLPARIPDRFLTNITAFSTSKLLSVFYYNVEHVYALTNSTRLALIKINGAKIIGVADPCNALDIYVLYVSFLFCFPGNWKRRLLFIALGVPYIFALNTVRCVMIAWLNMNYRGWVEISHHYIFTTALYLLVFHVWALYTKKGMNHAA